MNQSIAKTAMLLVPVCMVLIGCDSLLGPAPPNPEVTHENYKKIEEGMTEAEIAAILGSPHRTEEEGEIVVFESRASGLVNVYEGDNGKWIKVLLKNGKVTAKQYDLPESGARKSGGIIVDENGRIERDTSKPY